MQFVRDRYNMHKQYAGSVEWMHRMYPHYFTDKNRKKILFVQPRIDRFELYTLIGPAFYLMSQSKHISCMLTGLEPDKREFEDNESLMPTLQDPYFFSTYVPQADIVIFPFTYQSLTTQPSVDQLSVYDSIRQANPVARIIFTVDFDYYHVDPSHFNHRLIQRSIKTIEENIRCADAIITGNEKLPPLIQEKANLKGIRAIVIPSYFTGPQDFQFNDLDFTKPPENPKGQKIRIGIPSDLYRRPDIEKFKDIYLWLQNEHHQNVDLVFYGYHPDREIDLRDPRVGPIDNHQMFPKPKGRGKYKNFVNYHRHRRNDYCYNFKNFYNLNCDAWLFLYDPKNQFWAYSPLDVDILYAMYAETPVFTNMEIERLPEMKTTEQIKETLEEFIKESIKTRRIPTNRYKQFAISHGHSIIRDIVWTADAFHAIEEQFLTLMNKR